MQAMSTNVCENATFSFLLMDALTVSVGGGRGGGFYIPASALAPHCT